MSGIARTTRVQLFDPEGKFLASWTQSGAPFGLGLAKTAASSSPTAAHRVTILDPTGKPLTHWGPRRHRAPGSSSLPRAVCLDSHGDIYVAEINGKRVQKFTAK